MTRGNVLVIGGGLAGISAAVQLREAGAAVTLLESRAWLGGATCSFTRGDLVIDNGQHVFLRCCTSYRDLLARLGVAGSVALQDRFDVTVLTPHRQARLRRSNLPAPLHMTGALARYPLLSVAERAKVGRAALALRFANPASPALDDQRLGDWLSRRWQSEGARRRLWDLFIVSSLNVAGDDAATGLSAKVIKTALLESNDAADIGVPSVPLGELHGQSAAKLLARLGVDVRLSTKAVSIDPAAPGRAGGFRVRAVTSGDDADRRLGAQAPEAEPDQDAPAGGGDLLTADAVILAVPSWIAAKLSPPQLPGAARWAELGISPIVNVHVRYDRRVTRLPFAAGLDSPVQWVFDKTRSAGVETGQYLAISLSAAETFVDVPAARLREQFLPALEQLFPAAANASVLDFFVTRERRATFRQVSGSGRLRPTAGTAVPGLALAGAWTETGWPDTMEGAVRSGQNAAEHIISELTALAPGDDMTADRIKNGEIAARASS
ncbi:MAG TPA: hydroxysqualene dehydroxylase HpnE [Streptosporangiaceae bacterium]|jgi:squalene-associated FAD-dependent desaturase|nr:hydroxysqualene dehydroxylase HpnE [Streptosporangiaceae bacterium]